MVKISFCIYVVSTDICWLWIAGKLLLPFWDFRNGNFYQFFVSPRSFSTLRQQSVGRVFFSCFALSHFLVFVSREIFIFVIWYRFMYLCFLLRKKGWKGHTHTWTHIIRNLWYRITIQLPPAARNIKEW